MNYNKLLEKQINKFLPKEILGNEDFTNFIKAINNSYIAFERDRELSERAFRISEEEYTEINNQLLAEIELKKKSVEYLKESVGIITGEDSKNSSDDILIITRYLNQQISKRKNAEKVFQSLISNMQSGILLENENRQIAYTNQLFCDMFGIPISPDQLIGVDCSNSAEQTKFLFKDPYGFVKRINHILESKKLVNNEILELEDGRIFERSFIPIFIEKIYQGQLWTYTDITVQKKAQDKIAKSELTNRLILNAALDAIIMINKEGQITYWNPMAEKIFGWKQDEVINKTLSETIIPENYKAAHQKGMARYYATGDGPVLNKIIELTAINKAQEEIAIELSIVPIQDTNSTFFCSFIRDISERKKSDQILKQSEEKYRNIIANMNLGLIEVDNNEQILFSNQSFCEMSGYTNDELIGKNASSLLVKSEDKNVISSKLSKRAEGVSDAYEVFAKNKRGEGKWWLVSGAPRYNDNGELVGSIGIHLDISEQKRIEKELLEARELAESSSNAKQIFLANMSHEIRTPLNAIIGIGRQFQKTELNVKQKLFLESINNAGEHLLNIINDILDISKIDAGKLTIEKIGFNINDVIERSLKVMQHRAEEKGLVLNHNSSSMVSKILIGDPFRLNQILLNLLSNSIKFSDKGVIKIDCDILQQEENIQFIEIRVSDEGVGIDNEYLSNIFLSFTQEDKAVTRKYGGTGLGLSITKQLVELMGGTISVKSEKNQGAQFILHIPFYIGNEIDLPVVQIVNKDIQILKNKKILLVEDNEFNRLVITETLSHYHPNITEAENGLIATELLKNNNYDLVLMDVQMPVMDGMEATNYIRNVLNLNLPIIAITANALKGENDKCLQMGMNAYLSKPINEGELVNTMINLLEKAISNNVTEPLFNLDYLKEISRGNKEFIDKMIKVFKEQISLSITEMNLAKQNGNYIQIGKIAHKIKPSIDNLAIFSLKNDIRSLENLVDNNLTEEEISSLLIKIESTLLKVIETL